MRVGVGMQLLYQPYVGGANFAQRSLAADAEPRPGVGDRTGRRADALFELRVSPFLVLQPMLGKCELRRQSRGAVSMRGFDLGLRQVAGVVQARAMQ